VLAFLAGLLLTTFCHCSWMCLLRGWALRDFWHSGFWSYAVGLSWTTPVETTNNRPLPLFARYTRGFGHTPLVLLFRVQHTLSRFRLVLESLIPTTKEPTTLGSISRLMISRLFPNAISTSSCALILPHLPSANITCRLILIIFPRAARLSPVLRL